MCVYVCVYEELIFRLPVDVTTAWKQRYVYTIVIDIILNYCFCFVQSLSFSRVRCSAFAYKLRCLNMKKIFERRYEKLFYEKKVVNYQEKSHSLPLKFIPHVLYIII